MAQEYGLTMGIVDDLLAHPGLYLGIDRDASSDRRGAARMVVSPLPGGAGVTLDYEVLDAASPERLRGHAERTLLGRTHEGGAVMVIGHLHADSVAVLHETEPGVFELGAGGSPFPMKVVMTMVESGRLRHSWWYGAPGEVVVERDVAEVVLTT